MHSLASQSERRASKRFPIALKLRYRLLGNRAKTFRNGITVNMSSQGVLFVDEHNLTVGTKVEAHIYWPVKLQELVPLNLVLVGSVVRLEVGYIALAFTRHEFRIRKPHET